MVGSSETDLRVLSMSRHQGQVSVSPQQKDSVAPTESCDVAPMTELMTDKAYGTVACSSAYCEELNVEPTG